MERGNQQQSAAVTTSSSQNSMTGGSGESILTTGGTEGIPRSDLTCGGELQVLTWCSQLPLVYWMEIV